MRYDVALLAPEQLPNRSVPSVTPVRISRGSAAVQTPLSHSKCSRAERTIISAAFSMPTQEVFTQRW